METLEKYRQIVKELLTDHASNNDPEIECQIICDTEHDHYQFVDNYFLYQRQINSDKKLTLVATQLSEASFSKVWDNPEDVEYEIHNLERDAKRPSLMP